MASLRDERTPLDIARQDDDLIMVDYACLQVAPEA